MIHTPKSSILKRKIPIKLVAWVFRVLPSSFFLLPFLTAQVFIPSDPVDLKYFERNQYLNEKTIHSTFIRPFLRNDNGKRLGIRLMTESYFNTGVPNQENMDVRYFGKGSGQYISFQAAYLGRFFAFVFEPYMLGGTNDNADEIKRESPFSVLNDYRIIKKHNFTSGGLRQGAFFLHWKGIGAGYGKLNQWWGEGQHTSIAMTNNTQPFSAYHIGTIKEFRIKKIGLMGRYVFSKLNEFEDYRAIYYTALTMGMTYYGKTIISIGLSRNYLSGGLKIGVPWTRKNAANIVFEGLFVEDKTKLDYTVDGHDPWDQTLEGFFSMTFPQNKMKIFLEIGINDHRQNMVDFISQPDHASGSILGFRKYGLFGNPNLYMGFEYLNLARGKFHALRATPNFYQRLHYNDFSYKGRRWAAHSGSDSDDLLLEFGFLNDKWSFIPGFNFERHGLITSQPAEIKMELRLEASYKWKNIRFIYNYERENARHLGFPPDNVYAGEVTGERSLNTSILRCEYFIE